MEITVITFPDRIARAHALYDLVSKKNLESGSVFPWPHPFSNKLTVVGNLTEEEICELTCQSVDAELLIFPGASEFRQNRAGSELVIR
jgi:hypothetical protein